MRLLSLLLSLSVNYVDPHATRLGISQTNCSLFIEFQGFVISDWQGIDRITSPPHSNYTYSVQAGIQAGIDMVCISFIGIT